MTAQHRRNAFGNIITVTIDGLTVHIHGDKRTFSSPEMMAHYLDALGELVSEVRSHA